MYSFGTTDMRELGTKKHSRLIAICFFVGALGIGGMPPLNGFWSKFALYVAAAQAHLWWPLGIALFTSLLTLAVLIRAGAKVFMQHGHSAGSDAHAVDAQLAMTTAAAAGGVGARMVPGASISGAGNFAPESPAAARRCPFAMTAVIVVMTLLVFLTGWNSGFLNNLIDLSARALLGQMAGG
jgi:formate hydrogenlyase subunit 3/multisubunit Na+/H+ antiporter MnhD subunit